jgi:hypothetical protein
MLPHVARTICSLLRFHLMKKFKMTIHFPLTSNPITPIFFYKVNCHIDMLNIILVEWMNIVIQEQL